MKLGILQCDHVQDTLQSDFGDYPAMFTQLLQDYDDEIDVQFYAVIDGQFPQHIDECDVYMSSGSKWGANDDQAWIHQLEDFIRALYSAGKGFVGICFGHQLIAKALGGEVEKSPLGWGVGVAHYSLVTEKAWMQPQQDNVALVVSHQDQVCQLPAGSTVLMGNDFCPYSMFQVDSHFLGLQGHPEFSAQYSAALMDVRRDRIPAETIATGMQSLDYQTDDKLTTQWIMRFLKQTLGR